MDTQTHGQTKRQGDSSIPPKTFVLWGYNNSTQCLPYFTLSLLWLLWLIDCMVSNHLPKDKILEVTKLKAFAGDKLNVTKMTISLFDRVENSVEREKAFSPFLTMFSKAFFFRVVKSRDCVVKS